jgi:hypothetical protein
MAAGERAAVRLKRTVDFAVDGRKFMVEGLHNTSEVAARFAGWLDRWPGVQQALRFAFQRWDDSGPSGRRAGLIPLISRIVYASIFLELFHRVEGRIAAVGLVRERRVEAFDTGHAVLLAPARCSGNRTTQVRCLIPKPHVPSFASVSSLGEMVSGGR